MMQKKKVVIYKMKDLPSDKLSLLWSYGIVSLMIFILLTGVMASTFAYDLHLSFDELCFMDAKPFVYNSTKYIFKIRDQFWKSKLTMKFPGQLENETRIVNGYQKETTPMNEESTKNLNICQLDKHLTRWGGNNYCLYMLFYPIYSGIVAVLWTSVVLVFRGGEDQGYRWGISQPWRIVAPSIITFGIMTISGIYYSFTIETKLENFCSPIKEKCAIFESCNFILNTVKLVDVNTVFKKFSYKGILLFSRINLVGWIVSLIIMLARCIFVVDFYLVPIRTIENKDPSSEDIEATENIPQTVE